MLDAHLTQTLLIIFASSTGKLFYSHTQIWILQIPFPNPEKVHLLIESCAEHGQMQQRREREVDYGHQIANADNSV